MMISEIKEVIVVEGKDDTRRLNEWHPVSTIETGGDALDESKIEQIRHAYEKRGIIIFTDPDHSGEKIRTQLMEYFPNAKHAFITKKEGQPDHKGSLGVEHASDEAIERALANCVTVSHDIVDLIPCSVLMKFGLLGGKKSKERRAQIGERLRMGYANGKQLQKRLQMFHITEEQLIEVMNQIMEEGN